MDGLPVDIDEAVDVEVPVDQVADAAVAIGQPVIEGTVDPVALPEPPMSAADMDELSMDGDGEVDEDGPQPGNELHPPASRARKTKAPSSTQPRATDAARRRRQDGPPARAARRAKHA